MYWVHVGQSAACFWNGSLGGLRMRSEGLSQDPLQPRIQSSSRLTLKPPEPASDLYDNSFHTSHPAKSVSYIITCEVGLAQPGGEHVTFRPLCSSFSGTSTVPGRGLWCPVCAPPLSPSASYPLRCGFPAGLPPCLSRARETVGMLEANNSAPLQADGPQMLLHVYL